MRKFYIKNQTGVQKDLNGGDAFFRTPSGLGTSVSGSFLRISNGFYTCASNQEAQASISGELVFTQTPYASYTSMVDFMTEAEKLYLVYDIAGTAYTREVAVRTISKGELNSVGWLVCPLSLTCITPWYIISNIVEITGSATVTALGNYGMSIKINAAPHLELVNPEIIVADHVSGDEYVRCRLSNTLDQDNFLLYSNDPLNPYIRFAEHISLVWSVLNYVDPSVKPFGFIPARSVDITLTDSRNAVPTFTLTATHYWRTV